MWITSMIIIIIIVIIIIVIMIMKYIKILIIAYKRLQ